MNSATILVVDDDVDSGQSITEMLESKGFQAELALSGEKALELLQTGSFNLVILDLIMPGLGGVGTLETLRKLGLKIKVVILTGHTFGNEIDAVKAIGVDKILRKPVNPSELFDTIENLFL
ncbi:MAG: response regulator [Gammaproteobacteria bacterium]|nr:response regulator [Gammaproteobacteria bacterium]